MNKFCTSSGGNTGKGKCDAKLDVIYGVVFAPQGFEITPAQEAQLLTSLQAAAFADDFAERLFPIMGVGNVSFEGEEPTMGTLAATGITRPLRPGTQIYLLEYESGVCIDRVLNRFNDWRGGVYLITNEGAKSLWGFRNAAGNLQAIPCKSVSVFGGGFSDGQNITTTKMRINLGSDTTFKERIDRADFNAIDDVDSLVGLQTAILYPAGGYAVKVSDACDSSDMTVDYAADLAEPAVWNVTDANGAPVVPATVQVAAGKVTFTGLEGTVKVQFADPSLLTGKSLEGWASTSVTLTA